MRNEILSGTDLKLSKLCLGCLPFGTRVSIADGVRLIHYAFDCGVNFLDTADKYSDGESEICVGKAVKGRRDQFIIATKVGLDANLQYEYVMQEAEASLRRLQTEYIDIYYLHTPDYSTPIDETMEAIQRLKEQGKIRYFAISNYAAWQIEDICWRARNNGYPKPVLAEMVYNMLSRTIENEFIPFSKAEDIGVTVYNPLAGGLLSGKYTGGNAPDNCRFNWEWNNMGKIYTERYLNGRNLAAATEFSRIAGKHGMSPVELAINWCASRDNIKSVIIGVTREEQLRQNIDSLHDTPLPDTIMNECDALYHQLYGKQFKYNR